MATNEDDIELTVEQESAIIEVSKEFLTYTIPRLKNMLTELLVTQGVKTIRINIKTNDVNQNLEVKKHFDASDIRWLKRYIKTLRTDNYRHVADALEEEVNKLIEKEKNEEEEGGPGKQEEEMEEEESEPLPAALYQPKMFKGKPLTGNYWRPKNSYMRRRLEWITT